MAQTGTKLHDPTGNNFFSVHISLFGLVSGAVYGVASGNMVHAGEQ